MAKPKPLDGKVHVGTSGWQYDDWTGAFYPEGTATGEMLSRYAEHFDTVEINNSFYQLPRRDTVKRWMADVPREFRFCVKASRYLTHMKKLKDPKQGLDKFFHAIEPLEDRLAVILFQLPPTWGVNPDRLEAFRASLPNQYHSTFEFRDRSWFCQTVYGVLRRRGAALWFYDIHGFASPEVSTADFIYVRLHGPGKKAYEGSYDGRTLAGLARKIGRWEEEGKTVYCFFDNDNKAHAPKDSKRLLESVSRQRHG